MTPQVRIATVADIPRMIPPINAAFAIETFIIGTRTDEERMAELFQTGEFLIAEGGIAEESSPEAMASVYVEVRGDRGYFGMLAVDPARQGSGLGRTMVEAAENYCRERGCAYMDISVLNLRPELLAFYARFGYVETAREPFQAPQVIKDGFECISIVMSKAL